MPASVLAAGFSSTTSHTNNFGSSSGFSSNSLDTSYFQPTFGSYVKWWLSILKFSFYSRNRPSSPNFPRKIQAPTNPTNNSFVTREPPQPPSRPSPVPSGFSGNSSTLPAPMMPQ